MESGSGQLSIGKGSLLWLLGGQLFAEKTRQSRRRLVGEGLGRII